MKTSKSLNQKRMYKNPVLEFFSLSGPITMSIFHLSLISILIYTGVQRTGISQRIVLVPLFLGAFFTWTLAEYLLHRYVFHFTRENSRFVRALHYALHGYHHQEPKDANRLFMPPFPAMILLSLFFGLFYLLMDNYAWIFLAGFESGYLVYAFFHYGIHTRKAPKYFHKLWKHHALHHFKYPEKAFGVSTRFWDRVFHTMPPVSSESSIVHIEI